MPVYEFMCKTCAHRWEETMTVAEKANTPMVFCPLCQGFSESIPTPAALLKASHTYEDLPHPPTGTCVHQHLPLQDKAHETGKA